MVVDVVYEGLTIARGAAAREEGEGLFVELEAPMPVGTRLTVRAGESERAARVERVHEGVGPGVLVQFAERAKKAAPASAPAPAVHAAPAAPAAPAQAPEPEPDPGRGGSKRKRRRTLTGR